MRAVCRVEQNEQYIGKLRALCSTSCGKARGNLKNHAHFLEKNNLSSDENFGELRPYTVNKAIPDI